MEICSLVLSASGIYHRTRNGKTGRQVWIRNRDLSRALAGMEAYFRENPEILFKDPPADERHLRFSFAGIWAALILLAFYLAVGDDRGVFNKAFGSSAEQILKGEVYRTVTSLFLHVDAVHLAGNMAAIAIFGSAVCGIHGSGLGMLLILFSGILGNGVNALVHQTGHTSVGASTAVFGAIGILSAGRFWDKIALPERHIKAWLPLGAGLALLGILGSGGGRVDLLAHLFGFMAGILLETAHFFWIKRKLFPRFPGD
jgi:rhomboid protease GluP